MYVHFAKGCVIGESALIQWLRSPDEGRVRRASVQLDCEGQYTVALADHEIDAETGWIEQYSEVSDTFDEAVASALGRWDD